MNATCPETTETIMTSSSADEATLPVDHTNNYLYQAAIVLAILLFLISV